MNTFLEYIIKLAHSISLKVCVEGVEQRKKFDIVKQTQPDYIQGYLFEGRSALRGLKSCIYSRGLWQEGTMYQCKLQIMIFSRDSMLAGVMPSLPAGTFSHTITQAGIFA